MRSTSHAFPRPLLLLPVLCLVVLLGGCGTTPAEGAFKPQQSVVVERSLPDVHQGVPGALAGLGLDLISESESQGKVTLEALSPSAAGITIKLEAMTTSTTQLRVYVRSYSSYADSLAKQIVQAIQQQVEKPGAGSNPQ
jgi:hypothetical protein